MPYQYYATVTNVVDGDTFDATLDLGFRTDRRERFRILGINCPEVHGESKDKGLAAAAFSRATFLGRRVVVGTTKQDDFGRWLASVTLDSWDDFAAMLLAGGWAVPFMVPKASA